MATCDTNGPKPLKVTVLVDTGVNVEEKLSFNNCGSCLSHDLIWMIVFGQTSGLKCPG